MESQILANCGFFFHKTQGKEKEEHNSLLTLARGSFSCSLLDEKTSETFLCLQKAISLFLAAATPGVEESSHLLYMAGSSSKDFKDFKVPETEVQQCYKRSNRKNEVANF